MLDRIKPSLSYANVVSTACLFVVLGGAAYAATQIDGDEIAKRSIPGDRLERNDVGSREVAGLRGSDFRAGQLPAGPEGPQGPQGLQGPEGPAGPAGSARAFAFVNPDPTTPTLLKSKGFSEVTHLNFVGGYCLTPSIAIHPDNDPALVTTAGGESGGASPRLAEWRDSGPDCLPNQYEVITRQPPNAGDPVALSDTVGFVLMVP
jgi:hypothetical protein